MTSVALVDWLGRGGIAQCTAAWDIELRSHGMAVSVLTRGGRELTGPHVQGAVGAGRLGAHAAVARMAESAILEARPDTVVIQNWVVPALERRVHAAARQVGARLLVVVHDHQMQSRVGGLRAGLRSLLERADGVLVHSRFVQTAVERYAGRPAELLPLPLQVAMLAAARPDTTVATGPGLLGLHFGVVKRSYKGGEILLDLAADPPGGWTFAVVGVGSPASRSNLLSIDRFLGAGELCGLVAESAATLLPYRLATQSGAVVLAQACGSVPIASAVGGIVEQIEDGVTGRLIAPDGGIAAWREVLSQLGDAELRNGIRARAEAAVHEQHRQFVKSALELVS